MSSSGDGLLASLAVLYTIKERGIKLSKLSNFLKPLPQINQSIIINKYAKADDILKKSEKEIINLKKLIKSDSRLIVRKSGTENKIRIMVESKDKIKAKKIIFKVHKILKNINK